MGNFESRRMNHKSYSSALNDILDDLQRKADQFKQGLHQIVISAFKWRIICLEFYEAVSDPRASLSAVLSFIKRVRCKLNLSFISLTASLDRIVFAGIDYAANIDLQNNGLNSLNETRIKLDAALWPLGYFLNDCYELLGRLENCSVLSSQYLPSSENEPRGKQFGNPVCKTPGLKEIDRWDIDISNGLHRWPRHFALSKNGTINIAFGSSSSILEMNACGKLIKRLTPPSFPGADSAVPNGIAWDDNSRLWLTYGSLKCVVIWDITHNTFQIVKESEDSRNKFSNPFAICKGAPGQMLITDSAEHTIMAISYDGQCRRLAGGRGKLPGQFINPYSLVGIPETHTEKLNSFWVVDHRNHRLQKLSVTGEFLSELGACGLEKEKMALPLTATAFADGTLVVSMWHLVRCLILYSPQGEELGRTPIDFVPDEMLALDNNLFVADYAGNRIRIYEHSVN
jgi:hypothetical protein